MKITFLACAQATIVDQRSQNISLINILDSLQAAAFPFLIPQLSIAITFVKEQEEEDPGMIQIIATVGETEIMQGGIMPRFQGKNKIRFLSEMPGLVAPAPGDLKISVFHGEHLLSYWSIDISPLTPKAITLENTTPQ